MANALHDAFVEYFVRDQGRIYAYIATLLPNRGDAEDVFQQTSLTLWRKWEEYDFKHDFVTWACGIAHNLVRNFLRSSSRGRVTFTDQVLDSISNDSMEADRFREERMGALRSCIESLPRAEIDLVEKCYTGPETIRVIAEKIQIAPSALYQRLHRIRRALMDCVERRLAERGAV